MTPFLVTVLFFCGIHAKFSAILLPCSLLLLVRHLFPSILLFLRPTAPADANPPPSLRRAKPASVSLATEFVSWWWNDPLPPPPEYKGDPFLTLGERFGRPARVVLPNAYNETHRVYPLVLVLHGWKSNGGWKVGGVWGGRARESFGQWRSMGRTGKGEL